MSKQEREAREARLAAYRALKAKNMVAWQLNVKTA